jgi:hypothetical protein
LKAEKELTHLSDDLARRRHELPWVRLDKNYIFDTEQGDATLADLFRGRSQLLVYHFMFDLDWDEGCPSCSGVADGFDETHLRPTVDRGSRSNGRVSAEGRKSLDGPAERPEDVRPDGAHRDHPRWTRSFDFGAGRMPRFLQELVEQHQS